MVACGWVRRLGLLACLFQGAYAFSIKMSDKPVLVVGATGKVGRRVVQQLMAQNRPVRAMVRSPSKAQEVFGTSTGLQYPPLEICTCDLGTATKEELAEHVKGCSSIISVSGALRFSKWTDFLPWRWFRPTAEWCSDRSHPYFLNYVAQVRLMDLCREHGLQRFVRLTGLSGGLSAFSFVSVLFGAILSCTTKWHTMAENYLRHEANVPFVILRPGGLANLERNTETTHLQLESSGLLPIPARVGRSDVAATAIAALGLPSTQSYTLAMRWVGTDIAPKPQGTKEDGYKTVAECIETLPKDVPNPPSALKPFGFASGMFVYSMTAIGLVLLKLAWDTVSRVLG